MLRVAITDLQQVLNGGTINFAGQNVHLLGLRVSRSIVEGAIGASLPKLPAAAGAASGGRRSPTWRSQGLGFASPVLGSIGTPLTVQQTQLAGRTTPTDSYAATIAVVVSLMLVTLLLAAGLLAIERSEHAYSRLVRGLVTPERRAVARRSRCRRPARRAVALVMAAFVSLVRPPRLGAVRAVDRRARHSRGWRSGRSGWRSAALAREVSAASLMALLVSLPIAFVALVPASAVSGGVKIAARRGRVRLPVPAPPCRRPATRSPGSRPGLARAARPPGRAGAGVRRRSRGWRCRRFALRRR